MLYEQNAFEISISESVTTGFLGFEWANSYEKPEAFFKDDTNQGQLTIYKYPSLMYPNQFQRLANIEITDSPYVVAWIHDRVGNSWELLLRLLHLLADDAETGDSRTKRNLNPQSSRSTIGAVRV